MNYQETLDYLYSSLPVFHKAGESAYKPGLERVLQLSGMFGNPHQRLNCIHIAGTNGKGSTAHMLASVLMAAGYKTGLFTSPHLTDFRERIRIDGNMIPYDDVVEFVAKFRNQNTCCSPSFFELTTVMAFDYFAKSHVDIAVIETGLGGRLDSTNILSPALSVITNISLDHTSLLGSSEEEIAHEKAGIIKKKTQVIIGEAENGVRQIFEHTARRLEAPIRFASDSPEIISVSHSAEGMTYDTYSFGTIISDLEGDYQQKNVRTVLQAVKVLQEKGLSISNDSIAKGMAKVCTATGFRGRWTRHSIDPTVIYDTAHNPGGWEHISHQLSRIPGVKALVIGFVADKDVEQILRLIAAIPSRLLFFTQPSTPRRLSIESLKVKASDIGIEGNYFDEPLAAYKSALDAVRRKDADMIFIGGSNYLIGDLLTAL